MSTADRELPLLKACDTKSLKRVRISPTSSELKFFQPDAPAFFVEKEVLANKKIKLLVNEKMPAMTVTKTKDRQSSLNNTLYALVQLYKKTPLISKDVITNFIFKATRMEKPAKAEKFQYDFHVFLGEVLDHLKASNAFELESHGIAFEFKDMYMIESL